MKRNTHSYRGKHRKHHTNRVKGPGTTHATGARVFKISHNSDVFYRRFLCFKLRNKFKRRSEIQTDPDLQQDPKVYIRIPRIMAQICTKEEMEGLIQWALHGLKRLLRNNEFTNSQSTQEIREYYTTMSNPLLAFVQNNLVEDPQAHEPVDKVYNYYVKWCRENGFIAEGKSQFGAKLSGEISYTKKRKRIGVDKTRVACYVGIRLVHGVHGVHTSVLFPQKSRNKNLEEIISTHGQGGQGGQKTPEPGKATPNEHDLVQKATAILNEHNGKMRQTLFWDRLEEQGYEELTVSPILRQKHGNRFAFRGLDVRLPGPKPNAEPSVLNISDKKNIIPASLYQKNPDGQWSTEKAKTLLKYKWNDLPNVLTKLEKETLLYHRLDTWRLTTKGKQQAEKLIDTAKKVKDKP